MRPYTMISKVVITLLLLLPCLFHCEYQSGPDPWHYSTELPTKPPDDNLPPDLRMTPNKKLNAENFAMNEWFYRRILAIMLKGGQVKKDSDESLEISLALKFDKERWETLEAYIASPSVLSEEMFRRSIGYIEEAIYKPTFTEKITTAWSDYIHNSMLEYKVEITWLFGVLAAVLGVLWLWKHMSHKHIVISLITVLYFYEVFISYKEAEQQELDRFLKAVNMCSWKWWSTSCEVPPPDLLVFLKHMNPMKIAIKMITGIICEPMITISTTIKVMIHGVTDGFWFPFDKIMFAILVMCCNLLLVVFLIMIVFNFILNIPFKLSFLAGLFSVGINQRNRHFIPEPMRQPRIENGVDVVSAITVNRIIDLCSQAITTGQNTQNHHNHRRQPMLPNGTKLKRSASTGRLPNSSQLCIEDEEHNVALIFSMGTNHGMNHDGSGDALRRRL